MTIKRELIGDTIRITWVNSGVTPSAILAGVYDGDESLIDSASMVGSGLGHYYHDHTVPDTPGYYVAETLATINGKPYKNRIKYKAVKEEVD